MATDPKRNVGKHAGHRNRMRDRYRANGFNGMSSHEILEMLLFYSIPRKNTNEIAHDLIDRFGSLSGVLEAPEDKLTEVKGITPISATLIKMIIPLYNEYKKELNSATKLKNPEECGDYLIQYFAGELREHTVIISIDGSCRVIGFDDICSGDASTVTMDFKKIMQVIMKYPLATSVIIAHNHPGGIALPSHYDIESTVEIHEALKALGISLVDHIIVAGDEYISMASSPRFAECF